MEKVTFKGNPNWVAGKLKELVNPYLLKYGKTGTTALHTKAGILISLWTATYFVLVATTLSPFVSIPVLIIFGAVIAGIGFNLMHDGGHGSFSKKDWVNDMMGFWLNILGGNIRIWKTKHNAVHHTYTNIDEHDTDISIPNIARLHPSQKWRPWMKIQQVYMWIIYGVFGYFAWIWYSDFANYFKGHVGPVKLRFKLKDHVTFWFSKFLHLAIFILAPHYIFDHSWKEVLIAYGIMGFAVGLIISVVFQLAHVVELTEMVDPPINLGVESNVIPYENALHQLRTTANFATNSKWISWYTGGLNFQIEHHLFPKVSHVHYPQIRLFVKKVCKENNLPYHEFGTLREAIHSHYLVLKNLGKSSDLQLS